MSERRQAEASRIREKYPDRIPVRLYSIDCICVYLFIFFSFEALLFKYGNSVQVIVEKADRSDIPDIDKKK